MQTRPLAIALCFAIATAVSYATPSASREPSTNKPRKHVVVQFSNAHVHPEIARVTPGGNVAWVNYSTDYVGSAVFPASLAAALTCKETRPLFMKTGAGYQSIPITGEGGEAVRLPCPLKPGSYDYEIHLFQGGMGDMGAGMGNPVHQLPAKIVVE